MHGGRSRPPIVHWLLIPMALVWASAVQATPNHAHHHYHMGIRAYAGTRHAAMPYLEAANLDCDPVLARENAADMEHLAAELLARGERLTALLSTEEAEVIGEEMATMRRLALTARLLAAELGVWIDTALVAQGSTPTASQSLDAALQARIVTRSSELFFCFSELLGAHKTAEHRLGIPAPPDPPAARAGAGDE